MSVHLLEVNNLSIRFFTRKGIVYAVDDVSFSLKNGETLGLVGESGCGKTTTVMGLMNMVPSPGKITGGEILVEGNDIVPLSENAMREQIRWVKMAMVFQGAMNCLTPVYTIGKQMMETLQEHRKMGKDEATRCIIKYINLVGLSEDVFSRYPHELSGGMKQRIVIATALFLEPRIVICDEPTSALDVSVQAQILNLLMDLRSEFGLTYILISHDLAVVEHLAERVAVMYLGRIVEEAATEDLFKRARHPYTQALLTSVLTPDARLGLPETHLGIAYPNPIDPPPGCTFHPRCPKAKTLCQTAAPSPFIEGGCLVECHFHEPLT